LIKKSKKQEAATRVIMQEKECVNYPINEFHDIVFSEWLLIIRVMLANHHDAGTCIFFFAEYWFYV